MFPVTRKLVRVCPILKPDDSFNISNYRPMVVLSNFSKIFESVLYKNIFASVRSYLSQVQHGFVSKRSTILNLCYFTQFVSCAVDAQE